VQTDLFELPSLAGLVQADGIVTPPEEQALIASIDAAELSPFRFHGWSGKRLTASYGWSYDFDTARFAPTEPLLAWLLPLRAKAARFAHIAAEDLVQALLIRYDPGAGIGWHRDRPVFEHVVGISLGAPATMRFRRRRAGGFDRASAELAPRSIYHLSGEARHKWEHSIAAMAVTRWWITFRSLTEKSTRVRALPGLTPPAPRPDTSRFAEGLPHDEVGRHNIGGTQSKIGCDYR
jgi:alkylated DNA repair dioxygenase AlkB